MIEEHEQEYSEQYEDGFKTVLKFFSAENDNSLIYFFILSFKLSQMRINVFTSYLPNNFP